MFLELLLFCGLLFSGFDVNALSYDYTSSIECLETPSKPQYNGGIIKNPELKEGLKGWSSFGDPKIEHRVSPGGNNFIVAHSRKTAYDSVSSDVYLQANRLYTFSAWLQVSDGDATIRAVAKTNRGYKHIGYAAAKSKCWSMLKGGLTVDKSGSAKLYFETNNTMSDIWVDSVSLQPFTPEEWRSHQDESIEKTQKKNVRIKVVDNEGNPIRNATIQLTQNNGAFPFGCAINSNIIGNTAYQKWFTQRFKVTTFENEMKWYSNEPTQGHVDYSKSDSMIQFAKQNGVSVRGHNVFWNDPKYVQGWINSLSSADLEKAATNRVNSVVNKYKGQVIAWDVVNENLHFKFLESKLGPTASAKFYNLAHSADPNTLMFLNDYNTLEQPRDGLSTPSKYIDMIKSIRAYPGNQNLKLAIGLESHFDAPNIAYMRSALDTLSATGLPIWLTEVDVTPRPDRAKYLEAILREARSHPRVVGIVVWSAWSPGGCYRMCLTDNNFNNLDTGNVVDKLLREWGGFRKTFTTETDGNGVFEYSLFHGDFEVKISNHDHQLSLMNGTFFKAQNFSLGSNDSFDEETTLVFDVSS